MKKIVKIEGMSCEGCSGRVQNLLNAIPGITAIVSLAEKEATVDGPDDVSDDVIRHTITGAGYEVTDIVPA